MAVSAAETTEGGERLAVPNRIISEVLTEEGALDQKRFSSMKQTRHGIIRGTSTQAEGTATLKS